MKISEAIEFLEEDLRHGWLQNTRTRESVETLLQHLKAKKKLIDDENMALLPKSSQAN